MSFKPGNLPEWKFFRTDRFGRLKIHRLEYLPNGKTGRSKVNRRLIDGDFFTTRLLV